MARTMRERLLERDGDYCWLCGDRMTFESVTVDHVVPKSLKHTHSGSINRISNLRLAHFTCNNARGAGKEHTREFYRALPGRNAPIPCGGARPRPRTRRDLKELFERRKGISFPVCDAFGQIIHDLGWPPGVHWQMRYRAREQGAA